VPNRLYRLSLYYLLAGTILITAACKKTKNDDPPSKHTILTIDFTNDFINPIFGVIVFVSDMQGRCLADTSFNGNGTLSVQAGMETEIPGRFMVTMVVPEMGEHKVLVNMSTYLYTGTADWNLTGARTDTLGHATITLTNLPQMAGPVLYSSSGFFNLTTVVTSKPVLLYKNPDDLYIKLPTASGTKYKWITGLSLNGDLQIDAGTAEPAGLTNISLPGQAIYYEAKVLGYLEPGFNSTIPYTVDLAFGDGTPASTIPVSHPVQLFSGYHTDIFYLESWESPATWRYQADGEIPQEFKKINASVSSMDVSSGKVSVQKAGHYEVSVATWNFSAQNMPEFSWCLFGPDTVSVFVLPDLSTKFVQRYPELKIDSLVFQSVSLLHFIEPVTYEGFLDQILKSGVPDPEQRLETSSVIWLPLQSKK
jgi:hypothetical protein